MSHSIPNFSFSGFARILRLPNLVMLFGTQVLLVYVFIFPNHSFFYALQSVKIIGFCTFLIAAAGYLINDYYDVKIDLINKPKRVVVGSVLKRRVVMVTHIFFNLAGIALGFYSSPTIGIAVIIVAFMLWWYSNYLKRVALVGNMIVALITSFSLYIVYLHFLESHHYILIYALFAFLLTLLREIVKDLEDTKGDAAYGCVTLPILLGIRSTKKILYAILTTLVVLISGVVVAQSTASIYWFGGVLVLFLIFFWRNLYFADTKNHFRKLSTFCKMIMIVGIMSMIFLRG